jgi:hypothetical protein
MFNIRWGFNMPKKSEEINNKQNEIVNELHIKSQNFEHLFCEQYNNTASRTITETDWITTTPITYAGAKNTTYNRILPESINFTQNLDVHLDPKFLPYLHSELLIKAPVNVDLVGILSYIGELYEQDYCEVYGNGNLIYKGYPYEIYHEYSQADLDAGMFQEDYTKKVYSGSIEYSYGGDDYLVQGRVVQIEMFDYLGTGCGGGDYDYFYVSIDPGYIGSNNYAKFHDLQSVITDMTGILYHVTFDTNPTPPPTCIMTVPTVSESPKRLSWSFTGGNVDSYRIKLKTAVKYKKIGGVWVWQANGDFTIDSSAVTITTQTFTFVGYWLFYSNDTRYLFGIRNKTPLSYEGIYRRKELYNLPVDPYRVWSNISFLRNPTGHPTIIPYNGLAIPINQQSVIRLFKTTDSVKDYYRINMKGTFILSALSSVKTTQQVPVYNDTYYQSGSTYVALESHTLKDINSYTPANLPIEYKIRLTLSNPYEFSTRENYEL